MCGWGKKNRACAHCTKQNTFKWLLSAARFFLPKGDLLLWVSSVEASYTFFSLRVRLQGGKWVRTKWKKRIAHNCRSIFVSEAWTSRIEWRKRLKTDRKINCQCVCLVVYSQIDTQNVLGQTIPIGNWEYNSEWKECLLKLPSILFFEDHIRLPRGKTMQHNDTAMHPKMMLFLNL